MSVSTEQQEQYEISISPDLLAQLTCTTPGHKNKALEYVCLNPQLNNPLLCFHCLLNQYS